MHTNDEHKIDFDFLGDQEKSKRHGMKLPDGYLDGFEKKMLSKIHEEQNENVGPITRNLLQIVSVITIAATLFWGGLFLFNNPTNIDINLETLFNFKINKWLSASWSLNVLYDDDIDISVYDENNTLIGFGPRAQIKNVLSMGLSYTFAESK